MSQTPDTMTELTYSVKTYAPLFRTAWVGWTACVDPHKEFCQNPSQFVPLGQVIVHLCSIIGITSNIYLYYYLNTQTRSNTALKVIVIYLQNSHIIIGRLHK